MNIYLRGISPTLNSGLTGLSRAIASENLWRAQRDGVRASFIDETSRTSVSCCDYLTLLLDQLAPDAAELGCEAELERTQEIVAHGTSADHQLTIHQGLRGSDPQSSASLQSEVVDWIANNTAPSRRQAHPSNDAATDGFKKANT